MNTFIKLSTVLCVLLMSSAAMAIDTNWINAGGDQEWLNPANWSSGVPVVPGGFTAFLTNEFLPSAKVTTTGVLAFRVVLDTGGELDITAGNDLSIVNQFLMGNTPGPSDLNVDGTLIVGDVFAVGNTSGDGTLDIGANGVLNANGQWFILGHQGGNATSGTATVDGGTLNVAGFMAAGWNAQGMLTVNSGLVDVFGTMLIGNLAGASGDIVINGGEVISAGLVLGTGGGSGSLVINDGAKYTNRGAFGQASGSTVTINGTGEFVLGDNSLNDVKDFVFGNPDIIFSGTPKITGSLGAVIVTNTGPGDIVGDFDFDGGVDGRDFLEWQRGHTATPLSGADLNDWQTNFGTGVPLAAAVAAVPEPSSILQLGVFGMILVFTSRKRFSNF